MSPHCNLPRQSAVASYSPWKGRFFQFGPITGIIALALASCCVGFSWLLEIVLDDRPVYEWGNGGPQSAISITATVCNDLVRYAFGPALALYWWRKAIRGSSVGYLIRQWKVSKGFLDAIRTPQGFDLVFVAMMLTPLLSANNPILQRALSTVDMKDGAPVSINIWLPRQLNASWAGTVRPKERVHAFSETLMLAYRNFLLSQDIEMHTEGCEGVCRVRVVRPVEYVPGVHGCLLSDISVWLDAKSFYEKGRPLLFEASIIADYPPKSTWFGTYEPRNTLPEDTIGADLERESAAIVTTSTNTVEGAGIMRTQQCWLTAATMEVPVVNVYATVNILSDLSNLSGVKQADNTHHLDRRESRFPQDSATVAAFELSRPYLESMLYFNNTGPLWIPETQNENIFGQMFVADSQIMSFRSLDTLPFVMGELNRLFFRGALLAGSDLSEEMKQAVESIPLLPVTTYVTNRALWVIATGIQAATIASVACLYRGYLHLGRKFSLSPVEVAKAFDAPFLRSLNRNSDADDLIRQAGFMRICYGAVRRELPTNTDSKDGVSVLQDEDRQDRLVFAEYGHVVAPKKGETFAA